jgi:hypothetical protein
VAPRDILKFAIGREDHLPKERIVGFLELLRDGAKFVGDWAIYTAPALAARIVWTKLGESRGHWSGTALSAAVQTGPCNAYRLHWKCLIQTNVG